MLRTHQGTGPERRQLKDMADGVCSVSYMSRLLEGTRMMPSIPVAAALKRKFAIDFEMWCTPPARLPIVKKDFSQSENEDAISKEPSNAA